MHCPCSYTEHARRKTVTAMDVVYALKRQVMQVACLWRMLRLTCMLLLGTHPVRIWRLSNHKSLVDHRPTHKRCY
jgi:hypothetical protein